jgi:type VI secretion system secreted protein Hcp
MAAVDYFLKIEGIDGESDASKHEKEIEISSFSWGASQGTHGAGGGGGAGKVKFDDIKFHTQVNASSPKLMLACASGEHIKKAVLTCRKAGKDQQDFYQITFSDVLVSSYENSGHGQEGENHDHIVPTDEFSLNFAKIEYEYKPQKPDGTLGSAVKAGWDLKKGTKV